MGRHLFGQPMRLQHLFVQKPPLKKAHAAISRRARPNRGLPWLRIYCSQHFSQMKKGGSQMKLTLAQVLVRK